MMKEKILFTAIFAFVFAGFLSACATLPDDGKDAKMMRFTNLNNYRYCELFLIGAPC